MMRLASFGLTVDRLFTRSLNVPTRHRPANPRLGVRVWPGLDKPNPYPYPAVPGRVQQPVTIPTDTHNRYHYTMGPSNKTKQSKTTAAKCAQPLANTSALERNNHTDSPSNNTLSLASATRTEFRNFIELADSETIKHFVTIAASSPEGENLKFLWARAFKEGLVAGHALYGRTEEKLKEAHELGYEQGFKEGGSSKIDLFQAGI